MQAVGVSPDLEPLPAASFHEIHFYTANIKLAVMSLIALKRPFGARALPGLLLTALPIIEFFAMGYKMLCCKTAMSNNYELPLWRNWKSLFLSGLCARLIQAIWLTPAAAVFVMAYFRIQAAQDLQNLIAISNLMTAFLALLVVAAVFAPASVLNYVAETRFKDAFSLSMLKRLFSKAYLVGWLAAGAYFVIAIGILFGSLLLISSFAATWPTLLITAVVLPTELILLWFPSITVWTLLGEAWGKSIAREYQL